MERNPKNIFEQILYGLETTNANTVSLSEEIALLRRDVLAIRSALLIKEESEPNALGAADKETVEGIKTNNYEL